jgi:hypothetical protein
MSSHKPSKKFCDHRKNMHFEILTNLLVFSTLPIEDERMVFTMPYIYLCIHACVCMYVCMYVLMYVMMYPSLVPELFN